MGGWLKAYRRLTMWRRQDATSTASHTPFKSLRNPRMFTALVMTSWQHSMDLGKVVAQYHHPSTNTAHNKKKNHFPIKWNEMKNINQLSTFMCTQTHRVSHQICALRFILVLCIVNGCHTQSNACILCKISQNFYKHSRKTFFMQT